MAEGHRRRQPDLDAPFLKYWDSEIPALYGVRAIPSNLLLDPEGVIIGKDLRGEALHEALKQAIK